MSTVDGAHRPAPLSDAALGSVPGVLGDIARERARCYSGQVQALPAAAGPSRQPFGGALQGTGVAVIAEVKRASPSQGALRDVDPVELASAYQRGGAAAISVLTEAEHFAGSLEHLEAVAGAVSLPLLRKDFVVHPAMLDEARAKGASAALLIAAVLGRALAAYLAYGRALGLECLVEVHDEEELDLALSAGADILGVNNRDLRTLQVDRSVAPRLIAVARASGFDGVTVAESGYDEPSQLDALDGVADAVLVGTSLASSSDPAAAVERLLGRRSASQAEDGEPDG